MDIYINGMNDGGTYGGIGGPLVYSNAPANIGRHDSYMPGPEDYFQGTIDELKYYNRVLSFQEVQGLYDEWGL
jgi:hypothetical protein